MSRLSAAITALLIPLLLATAGLAAPDDSAALAGLREGKAIFDIALQDAEALQLYLEVIEETHASLTDQSVKPDFILAFRGPAVAFLSTDGPTEARPTRAAIAARVAALKALGVRFEVCAIATAFFGVDNATLLPGAVLVNNGFISLIGYQSQGYALIPVL